jgi:hypothetical protein
MFFVIINNNKLTYIQHFQELRIRVVLSLLIILSCFFILFTFSKPIIGFLTKPVYAFGIKLYYYKISEAFISTLKSCFITSLIITSPIHVFLITSFILIIFYRSFSSRFGVSTAAHDVILYRNRALVCYLKISKIYKQRGPILFIELIPINFLWSPSFPVNCIAKSQLPILIISCSPDGTIGIHNYTI